MGGTLQDGGLTASLLTAVRGAARGTLQYGGLTAPLLTDVRCAARRSVGLGRDNVVIMAVYGPERTPLGHCAHWLCEELPGF